MGLSSSQARLLSLTSRQHDIEYKAQHLEAQKLQMANESTQVYQEYENALNATKVQVKQIGTDGSTSYIDATYKSMTTNGYNIKFKGSDGYIADDFTKGNWTTAAGNRDYFIALETRRVTASDGIATNLNTKNVEVYTYDQLSKVRSTDNVVLMEDITVPADSSFSINNFSGTFDGNGHKISGLTR